MWNHFCDLGSNHLSSKPEHEQNEMDIFTRIERMNLRGPFERDIFVDLERQSRLPDETVISARFVSDMARD
jgi:hypothetical protein